MRKNTKSVLPALLKKDIIAEEVHDNQNERYVVDGGCLLQTVPWPATGSYNDVCELYIEYANKNYRPNVMLLFDGYNNPESTKSAEQERRIIGNIARNIIFNKKNF